MTEWPNNVCAIRTSQSKEDPGMRIKELFFFTADGKVLDEMKQLYQSSLKAAAARGTGPRDEGDDESDEPPDQKARRSASLLRKSHNVNERGPTRFDKVLSINQDGGRSDDEHVLAVHSTPHSNGTF